ncbi:MAG: isoprenylcysteine carboxylmethyltransferase family protein [Clostridia bacterium]|nr:isoprenylcysteine carboxylmethyltransferase family protein [Clostridia bacterium]
MKLFLNAAIKAVCGFVLVALLIFLPAGTFNFANGWLLIGILFIPMVLLGVALLFKAPELLQKRLDTREMEAAQQAVVAVSAIGFIGGFITAGIDFRFGWSDVPDFAVIAAAVVFVFGYAMYAEVMRENAYLSRTVKVEHEQKVVDTGLYGIVRHPMYAATLFMFLSMPIVLGSLYSFAVFLHYPIVIVVRIISEEKLLTEKLKGYKDYKKKVKYRLIPFVW